jgi:hypothetical protein
VLKVGLAALLSVLALYLFAEAPDTLWTRWIDLGSAHRIRAMQPIESGFLAAGEGDSSGVFTPWVACFDETGGLLWERHYPGQTFSELHGLVILPDGSLAAAGFSYRTTTGYDARYLHLAPDGSVLQDSVYALPGFQQWNGLVAISGSVVALGSARSDSLTTNDGWVVELDPIGNRLRETRLGGNGGDTFHAAVPMSDGGLWIVGEKESIGEDLDAWLVRLDAEWNPIWERTFGGGGDDQAVQIMNAGNDRCLISGTVQDDSHDFFAALTTAQGDTLWENTYGTTDMEVSRVCLPACNGGWLFAGTATPIDADWGDALLIQVDAEGNQLWRREIGTGASDFLLGGTACPAGGWVFGGYTYAPDQGYAKPYLVRLNDLALDCSADVIVGVAPFTVQFHDLSLPPGHTVAWDFDDDGATDSDQTDPVFTYETAGYHSVTITVTNGLGQVTRRFPDWIQVIAAAAGPQPANPRGLELTWEPSSKGFACYLPALGKASLSVYDLRGRRVKRFPIHAAGNVRYVWDGFDDAGRRLPEGIYLARLTLGGKSLTIHCILLR